jgi:hypothetical protein
MAILSNSGISSGSIVQTTHITQIIDAFTGVQEYDITLSGSLTLTGSLTFGTISNNIQGTASTSTSSSYSTNSISSSIASTSNRAQNETVIITFTHSSLNLVGGTTYFIGGSHITTSGSLDPNNIPSTSAGFSLTGPYILQKVRVAAVSSTIGSGGFNSSMAIGKNFEKVYDFGSNVTYNSLVSMTKENNINLEIEDGDVITFQIIPSNTGTPATGVTHNIQLYLVTNG